MGGDSRSGMSGESVKPFFLFFFFFICTASGGVRRKIYVRAFYCFPYAKSVGAGRRPENKLGRKRTEHNAPLHVRLPWTETDGIRTPFRVLSSVAQRYRRKIVILSSCLDTKKNLDELGLQAGAKKQK